MKKTIRQTILNLLDDAEFSNSAVDYQAVLEYLSGIEENHTDDSEFHYFKGYTALSFPDGENFYRKLALKSFEKALMLNPDNKNAFFHLMDCYYELGHYHLAAEGYAKVLKMLSEQENQKVSLSVFERILCCYLHLNWHAKFIDNYDVWIRAYRSTQDLESMTLPRDLILTLSNYLKNKGDRINPDLGKQFKNVTIDLLSILNYFPLSKRNYKDQIEALKNWDGQHSGPYIFELV